MNVLTASHTQQPIMNNSIQMHPPVATLTARTAKLSPKYRIPLVANDNPRQSEIFAIGPAPSAYPAVPPIKSDVE
jgi:hypothetical protein